MTRLPDRFIEDRALRDAAREVLIADLEHARRTLTRGGMATRVAGRISGGAREVLESAVEQAGEHRGIIAGLLALIFVWFARAPLLGLLGWSDESEDAAPDPQGSVPATATAPAPAPAQNAEADADASARQISPAPSPDASAPLSTGENHD